MTESEYRPDSAVPPGETLLEWLLTRFEEESGIDVTTLERLIRGETVLTESIAAKLYGATGVSIRLWLNLQKDFEDTLNRALEEVDAPFHCTYYTEGETKKWKMVICTSQKIITSAVDSPNAAPTSDAPDATTSQTASGEDTTEDGAASPTR